MLFLTDLIETKVQSVNSAREAWAEVYSLRPVLGIRYHWHDADYAGVSSKFGIC